MDTQKIEGDKMDAMANYWNGAVNNNEGWRPYDHVRSVEFVLDKETTSTLSRRDRRRLRQIQASCHAALRLDRARGVLRVTGWGQSVATVATQIASLSGPRKPVGAAVWAELMRTRSCQDDRENDAALARLQKQSGCRIHIDRRVMEVRLFGPPAATAAADKLLDEFEQQVTEQTLPLDSLEGDPEIILQNLQPLADACGVTLRCTDNLVVALGRHVAVEDAMEKLKTGDIGKTLLPVPNNGSGDADEHSPKKKVPEPSKAVDNRRENPVQSQNANGFGPAQWNSVCPMCYRVQQQCVCTNHYGYHNYTGTVWPAKGFNSDGARDQGAIAFPPQVTMSSAQSGSPFSGAFQVPVGSTHIMAVMAPFRAQGMECGSHILVPTSMLSPDSVVPAYFMPVSAPLFQGPAQNANLH
mmetsp:Transcript_42553/g.92687  ORF Transcript_42553/g.92687 Transcript_42553/m.92687 type:complete len:412 (+) Transcript_42553:43-1278(+)|eukprot:CAMPEP_0170578886 /NCGR_PEP_ID=MMETSP0224-20130122/5693_1 /TAXON_ID=285029 /ORGANISM="Togula jolla, Strain CCCM 725" /LENGTH=411 /DNA_ID=CAMNT_0010901881 /DNA_START=43 /DNA_END=1278 /DNA_ORIENTATION=+